MGNEGSLTGIIVQLLLFLSALFAGLTGAFAGDRVVRVGGQAAEAAITRAAEVAADAVAAITEARCTATSHGVVPAMLRGFAIHAAPLSLPARLTIGRRLE